jgi:hypothetical protein
MRNAIAAQTVSDEAFRSVLRALQQALEEPLGGPAIAFFLHQDIRLCFTLCGTWMALPVVSRGGIRKDEKISVVGVGGEAESLACRARRSWLDRLVGRPR